MARTRLYIDANLGPGAACELDADRTRYLTRVLRLRTGDTISVFDGAGNEYRGTLGKITKNSAIVNVGELLETAVESKLRVHLVQGISRGERMDFVVQKATELGVKRITPVLTEYGVVKLDDRRAAKRRDHWQKVAASACEQCGRVRLPLVDTPVSLKNWLGSPPERVDTQLILKPDGDTPLSAIAAPVTKVCLLIGPEGGFSDSEYRDAASAGFESVSLGPRILRTETAATAALAILQSRWGDLADSGL